jgi:hypothetical protein
MRVLELIDIAMLATQVAHIRDEENGLKRSLPSKKSGSQKPLCKIKEFLHIKCSNYPNIKLITAATRQKN